MIQINNLSLEFPHKTCFTNFSANIMPSDHIAIIGRNGSGKSSLLKMIQSSFSNLKIGYVPQIIEDHSDLSGGQRFNSSLTKALGQDPDILLLDEPTNHLDLKNRKSLMRSLKFFPGILIIVSHDVELLRNSIDKFWHIDNGKITIFSGNYDDYIHEIQSKRASIEAELSILERNKKDMHQSLMQEQQRAAKSKQKGQKSIDQRKWPTVVSKSKALQAEETSGRKKAAIGHKKQGLIDQLADLRLPEVIMPKFSLSAADIGDRSVLSIQDASIGYSTNIIPGKLHSSADRGSQEYFSQDSRSSALSETSSGMKSFILQNINLELGSKNRIAIKGNNGSGKTTLIKAVLNDASINKTGNWYVTKDIGYLDQHYSTLDPNLTVLETIDIADKRRHLNDFLFRKTEEVNAKVSTLSGGEKARLSLAQIAAKTPKLLILDEITNNLDLETRQHVIEVLKNYPGAMIVISHDEDFLKEIGIEDFYYV
jgi:ATPase subunit of ABC transporter with duplicated ATPase domains